MRPESEAEVASILRTAREPVSIVGGGTRSRGARRPLSTRGLCGITLYEPAALTLIARAGTPLAEIEATLAAENQRLAFEPPNPADARQSREFLEPGEDPAAWAVARDASTIGGVAAMNAAGPRRVQAGAARDSLIGVRFVDGTGTIVANGGRVMKNVTGYDLVKLMAGSRGTLGVLTEVALKVAPVPPASMTLALRCPAGEATAPMTAALTGPWDVSGAGWLPDVGVMLRLEGLPGSVALRAETLAARLAPFGAAVEMPQPAAAAGWTRIATLAAGWGIEAEGVIEGAVWRILCRPSQSGEVLAANTRGPLAMDWGGGLIVMGTASSAVPMLPAGARARRLTGRALELPAMDPATARLNEGLRARFDPRGILAGSD